MKNIVLVGYGGHAKSVADMVESTGQYRIVGYTDQKESEGAAYAYLGTDENLPAIYAQGTTHAVICIGYMGHGNLRDSLYNMLKSIGFILPVIIDATAIVSQNAGIAEGTVVGKGAIINAEAQIGSMCIINTGTIVEHEDRIGDFSHVAVGATLCGNVTIEDHCLIGANATMIQGITVGAGAVVAAGTTVVKDVIPGKIYYGLQSGK